ncbi:hypothetical protein Droror1_Dr00002433 [Drosera rotundifolia]
MYSKFRVDVESHMVRHWMFHAARISGTITFRGLLTLNALKLGMDLSTLIHLPEDILTIDLQYVTLMDKYGLQVGAYYLKFSENIGIRLWLPSDLTSITEWTAWRFPALRHKPAMKPHVFQVISLR